MDKVRPFLKWAGGKTQLLPRLRRFYPEGFATYYEPFLGSGAVFFDLHNLGLLRGHAAKLSDVNADLVGTFLAVRQAPEAVVRELERLSRGHANGGAEHFYDVRDRRFNPARLRPKTQRGGTAAVYTPKLAAMLIYLNRTGFNGLFRVNSRGAFNVPPGRYANPRIVNMPNILRAAAALRRSRVTIAQRQFADALSGAGARDFVYLDPPYAPMTVTARFTSYTAAGFGPDDQRRLRDVVVDLAERGCFVLLSNSSADEVRRLYEADTRARAAGLRTCLVPARRAINSRADRRGAVREYLITNLQERRDGPA